MDSEKTNSPVTARTTDATAPKTFREQKLWLRDTQGICCKKKKILNVLIDDRKIIYRTACSNAHLNMATFLIPQYLDFE